MISGCNACYNYGNKYKRIRNGNDYNYLQLHLLNNSYNINQFECMKYYKCIGCKNIWCSKCIEHTSNNVIIVSQGCGKRITNFACCESVYCKTCIDKNKNKISIECGKCKDKVCHICVSRGISKPCYKCKIWMCNDCAYDAKKGKNGKLFCQDCYYNPYS